MQLLLLTTNFFSVTWKYVLNWTHYRIFEVCEHTWVQLAKIGALWYIYIEREISFSKLFYTFSIMYEIFEKSV